MLLATQADPSRPSPPAHCIPFPAALEPTRKGDPQ